ncbi:nucleotidyltransferase family protein [Mucilaginibacter auburnensis]|uniref:Molybdenum cofactor cytidylyltransferase n=1 Tax=Mucilaginibacter auburnensis TaxID=1457233 RepID=A0A2H9VVY7_9SPHI|nr:nucleotidyltransferase family protein [Mucilaginibacter auburnensis]PJJ84977.1 molybdenum cofactor cytidylyltransferase [Mucilaginibacter auburnensis]
MTGIIILAAGASSRMGSAKQNLLYRGQTLLQAAISKALQCDCEIVSVVLGANAAEIVPTLIGLPIKTFFNERWKDGMGSSIAYGVKELLIIHPNLDSVLFLLTDQPFISADHINKLIEHRQQGQIVTSAYNNTLGPPILFDKVYFSELMEIKGSEGAKKLINKYLNKVLPYPFEAGAFDVDTPEDYERLAGKY